MIQGSDSGASACELMDRTLLNMARRALPEYRDILPAAEATLLVELSGQSQQDVEERIKRTDSAVATAAAARTSANRARIAALLRRLHGIDASPPVFDAAGVAKEYVEAAESLGALAVEDRPLAEEFLRLAEDYGERHPATVVCHNDLHAANILDGGGLVLVDFEFAVLASPLLDLASVAALNDYTASDQGDLLRAYFAGAEPPLSAAEFAKVVRLVRLMAHFWILATARGTERSELLARFGGVAMTTRNTKWQSG